MHGLSLLIIVIGASLAPLASAEVENVVDDGYPATGVVVVEPTEVVESRTKEGGDSAGGYLERRGNWGTTFSVGYSTYEPIKYLPSELGPASTPDGSDPTFGDVYTRAESPSVELQVNVKHNWHEASLGLEVAAAHYRNDADRDEVASTLTLTSFRVGATATFDHLFAKPYVVPYVSAGGYVVQFKEEGVDDVTSGTTTIAPYVNLGAQFSLDWIDPHAAVTAYNDVGLESTFVFLEVRKLMASSRNSDPDLSNNVSFGGGLRLEF